MAYWHIVGKDVTTMVSTTFLPSSHSISLKLDTAKMVLSTCFEEKIERCKKMLEVNSIESVGCVTS